MLKFVIFRVGPQLPKKITALASYRDYTFAAYGSNIAVFKRAHQVLYIEFYLDELLHKFLPIKKKKKN